MNALIVSAALVAAVPSPAQQPPSAWTLYALGQYQQAIAAGLSRNDAFGYAIAARAELAKEMMREEPCLQCLEQAAGYAREAIAADPKLPEGHIYLAVTLGYEARIIGPVLARLRGFPSTAKDEIDAALTDDPHDPWAWAAMGGWQIEIVHSGGALGRLIYGASVPEGVADFRRSFELDPHNIVLRFQYALALAAYDRETYMPEITTALAAAINDKPRTAYDAFAQSRARQLQVALDSGDTAGFERLVRHDQGYP
jgi:tetratricopeptide (TPR) repeat protein